MNNDFYKNAYNQLVLFVKELRSDCGADEHIVAHITHNNKEFEVKSIYYRGYGMVVLVLSDRKSIAASLQSLQVHFEYVSNSVKAPQYLFQILEPASNIQE